VDNHDVNRLASNLTNPAHLYTTYCLLFTMPGIPSVYYGSEWGMEGTRTETDDTGLRPSMGLTQAKESAPHPNLPAVLAKLGHIRLISPALQRGDYTQLHIEHEQLAFARSTEDEYVAVAINASAEKVALELNVPIQNGNKLHDLLNSNQGVSVENGKIHVVINPHWAVILRGTIV
jgi:glycosidase